VHMLGCWLRAPQRPSLSGLTVSTLRSLLTRSSTTFEGRKSHKKHKNHAQAHAG
jgi:hypothetical protein